MNFKREAGRRLKAARLAKGMTLKEVSRATGGVFSESRISNYEQGTRTIKSAEAIALANVLGVQPSHLLCADVQQEEGEMTPQEIELLRNFRALPEKDRNDYARRIGVLALAYREPVPDERLPLEVRQGPRPHRKTPRKTPPK